MKYSPQTLMRSLRTTLFAFCLAALSSVTVHAFDTITDDNSAGPVAVSPASIGDFNVRPSSGSYTGPSGSVPSVDLYLGSSGEGEWWVNGTQTDPWTDLLYSSKYFAYHHREDVADGGSFFAAWSMERQYRDYTSQFRHTDGQIPNGSIICFGLSDSGNPVQGAWNESIGSGLSATNVSGGIDLSSYSGPTTADFSGADAFAWKCYEVTGGAVGGNPSGSDIRWDVREPDDPVTDYVVFVQLPPGESLDASGDSFTNLTNNEMKGLGATDEIVFNWTIDSKSDEVGNLNPEYGNNVDPASCTLEFTDGAGGAAAYQVGDTLYLEAEDDSANADSGVLDTITVTLTNSQTGETETVTLTETGVDTGIFTIPAGFPTSDTGSTGNNDGTLNVQVGNTITVIALAGGAGAECSDTYTMPIPPSIVKAVDKTNASPGETLTYTIVPGYPGVGALTNVQVTDGVPANTTIVGVPGQGGAHDGGSPGTVAWELGTVDLGSGPVVSGAPGGTVTLDAVADTFVWEGDNNNYDYYDRIELYAASGDREYGLVRWDLSGIPAGSVVSSASLNFYAEKGDEATAAIRQVTSAWTETGVTWNTRPAFAQASLGTLATGRDEQYYSVPSSASLVSATQSWLDTSASNFGLLLEATNNKWEWLSTREGANPPQLTVTYSGMQTTNTATASPTLVSAGDTITVSVELAASGAVANASPNAPVVISSGANGATLTAPTGPVPATANIPAGGSQVFTYTYTVDTSGSTAPGSFQFSVDGVGDGGGTSWLASSSNSVLVSPPLTYSVLIDNGFAGVIPNIASISDSSGTIPPTDSNQVETVVSSSTIGDFVWNDLNGDGVQDGGEAGIDGVTLDLYEDSNGNGVIDGGEPVIATQTTSGGGGYDFTGLPAGNYLVDVTDTGNVLTGYGLTTANDPLAVTGLTVGQDVNTADFGYQQQDASIGDFVWNDLNGDGVQDGGEAGIDGVTLDLYEDSNGNGVIDGGEPVIATQTTSGGGGYDFTGLPAGNYLVDVTDTGNVLTGYGLTTANDPLAVTGLTVGQDVNTADFGYQQQDASIGDFVWNDLNGDGVQDGGEAGIDGVTLDLYEDSNGNGVIDGGEPVIATQTTSGGGGYDFTGLPAGNYLVDVTDTGNVLTGYGLTTANDPLAVTGLTVGQDFNTADFGYQQQDASIGDFVWNDLNGDGVQDGGEAGIDGVTLDLYEDSNGNGVIDGGEPVIATQTTSGGGGYDFTGLPAGDYLVDVTDTGNVLTGYGLTTANDPLAVTGLTVGQDFNTADFGYQQQDASIGDFVWNDLNGDGVQDGGEAGIDGVTLDLYEDSNGNGVIDGGEPVIATQTTSGGGGYDFTGLPAGNYLVDVTDTGNVLTGYGLTTANDPLAVTGLTVGQDFNTADFGYQQQDASIGDFVWNDLNGDGVQDGGEAGIDGVTLDLYEDSNGNGVIDGGEPVIATQTTSGGGGYDFTGLPAGNYLVDVTDTGNVLTGYGLTTANDPLAVTGLTVGQDFNTADFGYQAIKADTYSAWELANFDPADLDRFPASNPDGDLNSNLIEYAFCLDPESGVGAAICLEPRVGSGYDLIFHRRLGSHSDLEYCVLYIDDLANSTGDPASWTEYSLDSPPVGVTVTVTSDGNGFSETVTISNIDAPLGDRGFFTLAAKLDTNDDNTADVIHYTDVQGFQKTTLEIAECETYANPFLSKPVFSGKVEGVTGNNLEFGTTTNLGLDFTPGASGPILETGVAYYVEVLSGTLKGHRFDISTGGADFVTLASDSDLGAGAPFSTLLTDTGLPVGLDGAEIMIVEHLTLDDIAPPEAYVGNTDPASADRVLIPGNLPADGSGSWSTYFLLDHLSLDDYWVLQGGNPANDYGSTVIPPCQGFFMHPKSQSVTLETYGMVRENDFACPLCEGSNMLAAVYPVDLSPDDLGLENDGGLSPYVEGSGDPANSDQIYIWNRDGVSATDTDGYTAYWYVDNGLTGPSQFQRWATLGDLTLADQSANDFLLGDRSFFLRSAEDHKDYLIEQPWTSLVPVN